MCPLEAGKQTVLSGLTRERIVRHNELDAADGINYIIKICNIHLILSAVDFASSVIDRDRN